MPCPSPLLRLASALALLLPCLLAGCYVKVDKSATGEGKDVEVHLPVGGVQVKEGAPSAADMGLDTYPGAVTVKEKDANSANVHVGFGDWQINVRIAKFQTPDPQTKVAAFYRTALSRYGDVIECRDGHATGSLSVTHEGLGCKDKQSTGKGMHIGDIDDDDGEYSLRAGSRRHQHIVAIKSGDNGGTRFTLLRLDLPADFRHDDNSNEE